tara:strand:+ start:2728 stop:3279 length:552 start_codon:yes stop_codon:yes gene_type:complete
MYNALVGSGYLGNEGMGRETAPGVPNALDTSSYTNLNGDPQTPLRINAYDQRQKRNIETSGPQRAADAVLDVQKGVTRRSQKNYEEGQKFLNGYVAQNVAEAGGRIAEELFRLGMAMPPDETAEIIRESMVAGTPSFDVGVPHIPGKNLEGVPNAKDMREVLKRKYLKNPGGQTLLIPNLRKA